MDPENREEDLKKILNSRKKFYKNKDVTNVQPLIILDGDLWDVQAAYVTFQDYYITFDDLLDAVDFCYKMMISFKVKFPIGCPHIWSFLHRYVYEVKGFTISIASNIIEIISNELNKIVLSD